MRVGIVVLGVVLMVIGAALLFVPLSPQPPATLTQTSSTEPAGFTVSGFSITGDIPVLITWSSNTTVDVVAVACRGSCEDLNLSNLSGANETGTSGSISLEYPDGGQIWISASSPAGLPSSTEVHVTTALTSVGSVLLVVGVLLLAAGLLLRPPPRVGAPPSPAEPPDAPDATRPTSPP